MPKHYGPSLTSEEIAQQNQRHYPGLMAPKGSWAHWFWHSKALHTFITMVCIRLENWPRKIWLLLQDD